MFRLKRSMYTETAHFLRDHPGLCKHFHGHSYKWTVVVGAETLKDDMIMDFTQLKDIMNDVIGKYDHALVIDRQEMECAIDSSQEIGERVVVYSHRPTAERMACAVYAEIAPCLPPNVKLLKVVCRETRNNEACYSED